MKVREEELRPLPLQNAYFLLLTGVGVCAADPSGGNRHRKQIFFGAFYIEFSSPEHEEVRRESNDRWFSA